MSSVSKPCPVCAETIAADATVCRFCDSDLTPPPPLFAPSAPTPGAKELSTPRVPIQWLAVLRDVGIALAALVVGALLTILRAIAAGKRPTTLTLNLWTIVFCWVMLIAAFTLSACLVQVKRFRHVTIVALLLTALNVVYCTIFTQFPERGFSSLWPTEFTALIGAGLSLVFVPDKKPR